MKTTIASPLKWARSVLPPRLVRILNMTGIFGFFGAVCYGIAGWGLFPAGAAGLLTAFGFLLTGEFLLYALYFVTRRHRHPGHNRDP